MGNFKSKARAVIGNENVTSGALTAVLISTVLALNVVIFVIASFFGLSFAPKEKDEIVLSGATDTLFADAIADRKKVTITFCLPSESDLDNHSTGAFVHKTAKEYAARYDFINIEYLNLITRKNSKGENVDIEKYKTDMNGNETPLARSSVIFECGNNYKVITDVYTNAGFADFYTLNSSNNATSYNGEAFMASMIYWVTAEEHPTAYFTVGHSEQLDATFANLLTMAGYTLNTVNLKDEEVPPEAELLIISNPLSDFERAAEGSDFRTEIERLRTYMERGGNIYVSLDPYVKALPALEDFIAEYGISFSETEVDSVTLRNIVKDSSNAITTDGFTLVTDFSDDEVAKRVGDTVSEYSDGRVIIRECAALELSGSARPLLVTSSSSTLEVNGQRVAEGGEYCVAAYSKVAAKDDEASTIIVIPSIYATVSDALITNGYSNKDFIYSLFDNFYGREGMPYGCKVVSYNSGILENLTMGTARIYTAIILAVPAALAVFGTVLIVRRKNR